MKGDLTGRKPAPDKLWKTTALSWLSAVFTAALLMTLLPRVGVSGPIAAGLGFGTFSAVFLGPYTRFTNARYGDFMAIPAFLWTLLGCVTAIATARTIGVMG